MVPMLCCACSTLEAALLLQCCGPVGEYHQDSVRGQGRYYCEPPWYTVELRTALQGPTMGSRLSAIDRRQSLVAGTVFSGGCFFLL